MRAGVKERGGEGVPRGSGDRGHEVAAGRLDLRTGGVPRGGRGWVVRHGTHEWFGKRVWHGIVRLGQIEAEKKEKWLYFDM